jgi:hypothetical protein
MSTRGILFVDDQNLNQGRKVEVVIDWPVKLDGEVPLKLIVVGWGRSFCWGEPSVSEVSPLEV